MASLPPWLDFNPQTFVGAAESGRRAGQEDQRIGLERQSLAQSAAQAAAELSLKHQQLDAQAKQQGIDNQVAQQQMQEQFQQQQTRQAVTDAYHQQQYGFEKQRLEQAAQKTVKLGNDVYTVNVNTGEMKKVLSGPGAAANSPETFTRRTVIPAVAAKAGEPASTGLLGLNWKILGAHPAVPAVPGYPQQTLVESVKAARGTAPETAFAPGVTTNLTGTISPFQQRPPDIVSGTQDSTLITPAPANPPAKLKFIRDANGDLVLDNSNS